MYTAQIKNISPNFAGVIVFYQFTNDETQETREESQHFPLEVTEEQIDAWAIDRKQQLQQEYENAQSLKAQCQAKAQELSDLIGRVI